MNILISAMNIYFRRTEGDHTPAAGTWPAPIDSSPSFSTLVPRPHPLMRRHGVWPEKVGQKKTNLEAGQRKLAGSLVITHKS